MMFLQAKIQPHHYEKQNQVRRQFAGNFSSDRCYHLVLVWKDQYWLCFAGRCTFLKSDLAVQSKEKVAFIIFIWRWSQNSPLYETKASLAIILNSFNIIAVAPQTISPSIKK